MLKVIKFSKPVIVVLSVLYTFPLISTAEYSCPTPVNFNCLYYGPETSVAFSPVHPHNYVLMAANLKSGYSTFNQVQLSTDSGRSWTSISNGMMPDNIVLGEYWMDPSVAIDLNNKFYVCYMDDLENLYLNISDNFGSTWQTIHFASNADKEHIWVDNGTNSPYQGNLYAAWYRNGDIIFNRSTDGGTTWQDEQVVHDPVNKPWGVNIKTGRNGMVYLVWTDIEWDPVNWESPRETSIWMARSTNGGEEFEPATEIMDDILGISFDNHLGTGCTRVRSAPCLTVNPDNGQLFLVWANHGFPGINIGDADIYMISSTDQGVTWSDTLRINCDDNNHQLFPWISCAPETKWLSCVYYNWDGDLENGADVYIATSFDNGKNWTECQVNGPNDTYNPEGCAQLDYIGIDSYGPLVVAAWNADYGSTVRAITSAYEINSENCCVGIRGDADYDGELTIYDAYFIIDYVFKGGAIPYCYYEADANSDGYVNVGDAVTIVNHVVYGGPAPGSCP